MNTPATAQVDRAVAIPTTRRIFSLAPKPSMGIPARIRSDLVDAWRAFCGGTRRSTEDLLIGLGDDARQKLVKAFGDRGEFEPAGMKGTYSRVGASGTFVGLMDAYNGSPINQTELYTERAWDTFALMHEADGLETAQRAPHVLKFAFLALGFTLMIGTPILLVRRYGFNDDDLGHASNMAQFVEAFAAATTLFLGWWIAAVLIEGRLRSKRALLEIHRCRVLIQLIDSHALSNEWVVWRLSGVERGKRPLRIPELSAEDVVDYLMFASVLARIVSKIATIHAQWVVGDETTHEADALFRVAVEIEQNCLLKMQLVREYDRDRMARYGAEPMSGRGEPGSMC